MLDASHVAHQVLCLGTVMSVLQDVIPVPFVFIIPLLGLAVSATELAASLGW